MSYRFEEAGADGYRLRMSPFPGKHVFVVEDEELVREGLAPVLEEAGYAVSFAENGKEALSSLYTQAAPDVILFDLKMPVMNGWEFRKIQQENPRLRRIPVVAISADGSAQAAAVSAHAYLRKPFGCNELLEIIERVLIDDDRQALALMTRNDRLTALARLGAGVGHEINNPLAVLLLNLSEAIGELQPPLRALETPLTGPFIDPDADEIRGRLVGVLEMLRDCEAGSGRIRDTVAKLQRLSHQTFDTDTVDVHALLDQALSRVWNQLRERTRLVKCYGTLPRIRADGPTLLEAFSNLILNAIEAVPQGNPNANEIQVVTRAEAGENGVEVVVEIRDSGPGLSPEVASRAFEPFFTTKVVGSATASGLGLSISRQTVMAHGGQLTLENLPITGTVACVRLPVSPVIQRITLASGGAIPAPPGRRTWNS